MLRFVSKSFESFYIFPLLNSNMCSALCRISDYMDLTPVDIVGKRCYHFIHAEDVEGIRHSHLDCKYLLRVGTTWLASPLSTACWVSVPIFPSLSPVHVGGDCQHAVRKIEMQITSTCVGITLEVRPEAQRNCWVVRPSAGILWSLGFSLSHKVTENFVFSAFLTLSFPL